MSDRIFSEGGPLGTRRISADEYEMRIDLPVDEFGFLGRECTTEQCSPGYFKVKPGTGIVEEHSLAFCPYCHESADPGDFITSAQKDYVLGLVGNEVAKGTNRILQGALGLGPSGKKKYGGGFLSVEVSMKPSQEKYVPRPLEEELRRDILCPHCGLEHAVFGIATWCPDCGKDIFLVHVERELGVIAKVLSAIDSRRDELGARVAARDVENALEDAVSIFEAVLKIIVRKHLLRAGEESESVDGIFTKDVRNRFQNVHTAAETFKKLTGVDLLIGVNQDDAKFLDLTFQKRHPITHNLGVVDRKYLERVLTGELEGKEVLISQQEVQKALELVFLIISHTYSHVLEPPLTIE